VFKEKTIIIIGAGAAGFFAAMTAKKNNPHAQVIILEKHAALLSKVRVSGGGRCNVTHACFDPLILSKNYPRGGKELVGPFNQFGPKETIEWFKLRGVDLKTEADGRMFPITDNSETIIECFLNEVERLGIEIRTQCKIEKIQKDNEKFEIFVKGEAKITADKLILTTGSSTQGHFWAKELGHTIIDPVPSLFTFNIPNSPLKELSGISIQDVKVQIKGTPFSQLGPLLITHFGFSGPAVLKLSAWAARELHEKNYEFEVQINWLPKLHLEEVNQNLIQLKKNVPHKSLLSENLFKLPKNFWKYLLKNLFKEKNRLNDFSLKDLQKLSEKLVSDTYSVKGKTTHKEEFVTCGGILLKEVNFKTMESKVCTGLFFAGEILDIDGITGGFNFQNAWTTGFISGRE
jgi:predicted Rossmann fold flavoprotein